MTTQSIQGVARPLRTRPLAAAPGASVTVVVSCYNYARYLEACVVSAVEQEGVDVDVIIVDDASTDGSLAEAHRLARRFPAVRVLAHARNRGTVETFNDGAREATGEFLVRLDADDLLTPGSLARAVAVAQQFPSVGLVYGHPLHFSGSELPRARLVATGWTVWPGRTWLADRCRQGRNVITSPEVLMRRAVIEDIGYQAPLRHSHDMEHWLRIAAFSDVAYVHGADQAWHREHDRSLSALEVDSIVDLEQRLQAFETLFGGGAGQLPEAGHLFKTARNALAHTALAAAGHALDASLSRQDVFEPYVQNALRIDPALARTEAFRRLQLRGARDRRTLPDRAGSLWRRTVFWAKTRREWRRWHRDGVY